MALYLAEKGFHVYATMRDVNRSEPLWKAASERKVSLSLLSMDVTQPLTIEKAVEQILRESGEIYGLINNAGIQMRGFFEDITEQEVREVFNTNVFGTAAVTRTVLPFMRKARKGRIIFIGSVGGRIATMGSSIYCATKFALEGFAEALYQELLPFNIQVSIVEPGFVRTELFGRNRTAAERATAPSSLYADWFRRLEGITDERLAKKALHPKLVAETVHKVLTRRRTRLRHVVGPSARLLVMSKRLLPLNRFDRIYTKKLWGYVRS
jgi:short-subunit dehydrogenase